MMIGTEFVEMIRKNPVFCTECRKQESYWVHADESGEEGLNVYECRACGAEHKGRDYVVTGKPQVAA